MPSAKHCDNTGIDQPRSIIGLIYLRVMSCSKSIAATMLGIVAEEGLLDLGQPLTTYIPELEGTGMTSATLQRALDMRVGVKFGEDYDDLDADWRQCELATGWRDPGPDYCGPTDMVGYMQTLMALGIHGQTLYIDPGRDFEVAKFSSQANVSMILDQIRGFEAISQRVCG